MSAQGNNGSFNETWLTISEELSGSGYDWEKSLENNDVPPMTDPANFTTADLESLLFSEVGVSGLWSYREDIDYPGGGGLQNYFSAVLDSVSVEMQYLSHRTRLQSSSWWVRGDCVYAGVISSR